MTPEERQSLKDRIAESDAQARRVEQLEKAIERITGGELDSLRVSVNGKSELFYSLRSDGDRFYRVCWLDSEAGLTGEIVEALLGLLTVRLEDAQGKYDQA